MRLCVFFAALFVFASSARAGVDVVQALSFGEVIVRNNDVGQTIVINTDGSYSISSGFIEITAPQEGVYDITGLTADETISSITVTQTDALNSGGHVFAMHSFQTVFTNVDSFGVARVTLGATAESSGTGSVYPNDSYEGELQLEINY